MCIRDSYKIGVNGEILDGKFFPVPKKYRLQEGERVEIYNALKVDPSASSNDFK